ncbi:CBL-interacting serine/threonine-protein kinase 9 [Porphyridium purpureum]|uniref:non-specific serine/threonine protein kinase n=1 Tax=Porphyridium purpureum TaxID=35688 RepID=A0A5J4YVV4_PORPP|nr:CBL-interacting serine/threonine-protein kinase 9 [Porphyridium purpureum]|eukprot:POR7910..scf227_4
MEHSMAVDEETRYVDAQQLDNGYDAGVESDANVNTDGAVPAARETSESPTAPNTKEWQSEVEQSACMKIGDYFLFETLGEGGFSVVKRGRHVRTRQQVAVKVIDKAMLEMNGLSENISREVSIQKSLKHRNVTQLLHVLSSPKKIYLVMELVTGGELFEVIEQQGCLPEDSARNFFQQIIDALDYCHKRGVTHRDLKPENVLLDRNGKIKLTDFGFSSKKAAGEKMLLFTQCGTPDYCAPEMFRPQQKEGYSGEKLDIWAAGIILYAMLSGFLPFAIEDDDPPEKLSQLICACDVYYPSEVSPGARDLLESILVPDPSWRFNIAQIRKHPWFREGYQQDEVVRFHKNRAYKNVQLAAIANDVSAMRTESEVGDPVTGTNAGSPSRSQGRADEHDADLNHGRAEQDGLDDDQVSALESVEGIEVASGSAIAGREDVRVPKEQRATEPGELLPRFQPSTVGSDLVVDLDAASSFGQDASSWLSGELDTSLTLRSSAGVWSPEIEESHSELVMRQRQVNDMASKKLKILNMRQSARAESETGLISATEVSNSDFLFEEDTPMGTLPAVSIEDVPKFALFDGSALDDAGREGSIQQIDPTDEIIIREQEPLPNKMLSPTRTYQHTLKSRTLMAYDSRMVTADSRMVIDGSRQASSVVAGSSRKQSSLQSKQLHDLIADFKASAWNPLASSTSDARAAHRSLSAKSPQPPRQDDMNICLEMGTAEIMVGMMCARYCHLRGLSKQDSEAVVSSALKDHFTSQVKGATTERQRKQIAALTRLACEGFRWDGTTPAADRASMPHSAMSGPADLSVNRSVHFTEPAAPASYDMKSPGRRKSDAESGSGPDYPEFLSRIIPFSEARSNSTLKHRPDSSSHSEQHKLKLKVRSRSFSREQSGDEGIDSPRFSIDLSKVPSHHRPTLELGVAENSALKQIKDMLKKKAGGVGGSKTTQFETSLRLEDVMRHVGKLLTDVGAEVLIRKDTRSKMKVKLRKDIVTLEPLPNPMHFTISCDVTRGDRVTFVHFHRNKQDQGRTDENTLKRCFHYIWDDFRANVEAPTSISAGEQGNIDEENPSTGKSTPRRVLSANV